jgi:flavin reductase (DIM6/NTAB) family NADH-FMN oxidoreductase RutF
MGQEERLDMADSGSNDERLQVFRQAFRQHAAGVAIITSTLDGAPYGFTATSLASLSATPPRFTFNIATTSMTWRAVAGTDLVAVHMLGGHHSDLARQFAKARDRFEGVDWRPGPGGVPLLEGTEAWLLGKIHRRFVLGSNAVVVADVLDGGFTEATAPLLYHGGSYGTPKPLDYEI